MKLRRWVVAIVFIALTILILGFFKLQQIQDGMEMAASFPEPSATVNTVVTEASKHKTSYQVTGQAAAPQVINIQNELAGTINKVNFKGGDSVKKGQLILGLNIFEEKAQLVAAKAKLKLAKKIYKRMGVLVKGKKVSQQEFDSAEADLRIAQSEIANLESVISKKQLFAPFDGNIGLETYQEGQFIPANSNIITLIGNGPEIWIDFQLAQTKQKLSVGDTVQISVISDDANEHRTAAIIAVNSFVKAQSRHLSYRAQLDMGQSWLNHNEIVQVKVFKPARRVIMVPKASVNRNHYGSFVFELIEDDAQQYRAKKVPVVLGARAGDQQVILSGIESEMLIATDGAFKLRDGLLVYPKSLAKSSADDQTSYGAAK